MSVMESQISGDTVVYSTDCSGVDQRKHQSSASLDFVWGIHWWPVNNSPHKGPVTRKSFPFAWIAPMSYVYSASILDLPFYEKKKKVDNFICLLEFEWAKRLKAYSQAIPAFDDVIFFRSLLIPAKFPLKAWLLMSWQNKEPEYQPQWYWANIWVIFQPQHLGPLLLIWINFNLSMHK